MFKILNGWISSLATPAFSTIRQWLLKIGLFKLNSSKYSPGGWFFIVDTSIQMGSQKCVVVLGLKKQDLCQNFCPKLEEMEPLVIRPLYSCPGEVIHKILEEAARIIGTSPLAVLSDAGTENIKGIRLFCQDHPETIHLFDISHKINIVLKNLLKKDPIWTLFKTKSADSLQFLKHSSIAYLVPPKQRDKDRMHSAFDLIEWGWRLLCFVNSKEVNTLSTEERDKIVWIKKYEFAFSNYLCWRELCKEALDLVHEQGYYLNVADDFLKRTADLLCTNTSIQYVQNEIVMILREAENRITKDINYLGSSEIIETLFGKFKAIEGDHAKSGLSSSVLALPALVGKLNESIVKEALETTLNSDVEEWIRDNMGQTFLSKRRNALKRSTVCEKENDLELCE